MARVLRKPRVIRGTGGPVTVPGAACLRRWHRARRSIRTSGRHGERPSGESPRLRHAGRGRRGRHPSPGCTPQGLVPVGGRRGQGSVGEARRRRKGISVEGRPASGVPRPPADHDLLGVGCVARDEVVGGRVGRGTGEHHHTQVERAPPRVDRRGPAPVRRAERRERQRRLGGRGEVLFNLGRVVAGVLVVLVQRHAPRNLLRHRVDAHGAARPGHRRQHIPGHLGHRPVRDKRHPVHRSAAVLHHRLVRVQVQRHHQRPGAIRRGQQPRLPAARSQPQRRVQQLRLGRRELHGQLAQHLSVGMQRVTCRTPPFVGDRWPVFCHDVLPSPSRTHATDVRVKSGQLDVGPVQTSRHHGHRAAASS